ncbi:hypothetical protein L6R52_26700 [Myxococcota bacterium]|nr:hypothetical protein [Myxococcota bacterium]
MRRTASKLAPAIASCLAVLGIASPLAAKPIGPTLFCETYPDAPVCLGGTPACTYCHSASPPARNPYGLAVERALLPGQSRPLSEAAYTSGLPDALRGAEESDADGDGFTSGDEITAGTHPADDLSFPDASSCPPFNRDGDWDVCFYDPVHVFKKVRLDFCGKSPTYEELEAFRAEADKPAVLARELDACTESEFWRGKNGQLWQLAHNKVRPLQAIKAGEEAGPIPLADYYDDYNLFVWTQIDDHDARDVLLADYFVRRSGTTYTVGNPTGQQGVEQARRAGMLTTRWALVYFTMFTALPRTAAAQAYRAYLGLDIAKLQGLFPVPNEPVDYDAKGVADSETCRNCHSTLDPLTYPFKNYSGLTGDIGEYMPRRLEQDFRDEGPRILETPESGYIFGQPVADLGEWARVAANSDQFARATVMDYWKLLLGAAPRASEEAEFNKLWTDLRTVHGYSVERMLHALIKTEAYGVP